MNQKELIAEFERLTPSQNRLIRAGSSLGRSIAVVMLRKMQKLRQVTIPMPWGHRFKGTLPESVTAVLWRFGCYEPATSTFVVRHLKPGGCFVDIGAHFGYFTMLASHLVGSEGKVVAVEAMPDTYAMLQQNVRSNGLANVTALNHAAAAEICTLTFKDYGVVNSSLNTSALPRGVVQSKAKDVKVDARPADTLLAMAGITHVDIIKIDAESSEEFVIRGLQETLLRDHPIVLIELGGTGNDPVEDLRVADIVQFLTTFGYRGFRSSGSKLIEITETKNLPYMNVIFKAV